jgi:hypothetical protein
MENSIQSDSPLGKLVPMLFFIGGIIGLYYLYQYLFGPSTSNSSTLIGKTQSANIDASKPITVSSNDIPTIYEGGEFSISTWIYISNWTYRSGFNKHILSIGGPNFDTIRVYLGGMKPTLNVRLQTREAGTSHAGAPKSVSDMPSESLDKLTQNSVFNMLQTHSGLLDPSPLCDLPEVELQRWINITIAVNGRTVDVYMDGKLARSCVLPSFYKVDAGGYQATLLAYGGFGGQISTTSVYDTALNPEAIYKSYMAGPEPISSILGWLQSFFTPSDTL